MKVFSAVLHVFTLCNVTADFSINHLDCTPCVCTLLPTKEIQANCGQLSLHSLANVTLPENTSILLLQHNNLVRTGLDDFHHLPNLTKLDLSYNKLRHIDNDTFSSSVRLEYLNLEHNAINESCYTSVLLKNQVNLTTLKLNGNNITACPTEMLTRLISLEALYIDGVQHMEFRSEFAGLSKLEYLTMSGYYGRCEIGSLLNDTFTYLTSLKYLEATECQITTIDTRAFVPLVHLIHLNLSNNQHLGLRKFGKGSYGLQFTKITTLVINNIVPIYNSCVVIKKEDVLHLSNTSLTSLYIDDNAIENIRSGVLAMLPSSLQYVSAQRNRFRYGAYLWELPDLVGLSHLQMSGVSYPMKCPNFDEMYDPDDECQMGVNDDGDVERTDKRLGYSFPPHGAGYWPLDILFPLTLPPKLHIVQLNFTQQIFAIGNVKFQNSSLRHLDLSSNLIQFEEGSILGLNKLTYLDLSNNLARNISLDLLKYCTSLKTLNISYNFFGWKIRRDNKGKLFRNLVNLRELVVSYNDLKALTDDVLHNLSSLVGLNASNNGLYNFRPNLNNIFKLQWIDLSHNQIKWLHPRTMDAMSAIKTKSPNFTLILIDNPLMCECENLGTLEWLLVSGVTPEDMTGYYCLFTLRTKRIIVDKVDFGELITDLKSKCTNNFGLALGCLSVFLVSLGFMTGSILYRYRWKLRYLYYAARLKYIADNCQNDVQEEFLFDAFVSYADEDRSFVINEMRANLEHEHNMTLNIHHRDFLPGEPIASNIIGAIRRSRKTLILMTQNFLDSYWCMYELRMAHMESISTGRNVIIIIMYQSVPARNIPPEFLHLLETDSYIEYPHAETHDSVFWRHLVRAIRHRTMRQSSIISE